MNALSGIVRSRRRLAMAVAATAIAAAMLATALPTLAGAKYVNLTNGYCPASDGATGYSNSYTGSAAAVGTYYLGSSSGCYYRMIDDYWWKIGGSWVWQGRLQWVTYNIFFNDGGNNYPGAKAWHRICDSSWVCGSAKETLATPQIWSRR